MKEPFDTPAPPQENLLRKVVLVNFGILLAFVLISFTLMQEQGIALMVFAIIAQAGFNFFFGIILLFMPKWLKIGQSMMISSFVVLVVGFGACLARLGLS